MNLQQSTEGKHEPNIVNIFIFRDTEVVLCIILVLLKSAYDIHHYIQIK